MAEMHVHYTPRKALASSSPDASFPILAISILGILTTAILLVSYYVFVIKCCLNWRRSDVINRLASSRSRRQRRHDDDPFMVYAAAAAAERRGVEASVIRAIPIFRFRKGSDVGEQKSGPFQECAVCLSEFEEGERLRRLPGCSHAFHIDCIDMWLQSNANCPLCRSDVTAGVTILPADHVMPQGVHQEARYNGGGEVVEVRDGRGDGIRELTLTVEATMQQQQQQEHPMAMMPRKAEQRMAQNEGRGKYHHICSMGDECIDVRWGKDEQFSVQPIRRSFSVDSSRDRLLYLSLQEILQQNPHFYSQEIVSGEGSSSDGVPPAGRIRRSCFSFGRGSRSSVLPMAMDL